MIHRCYTACSIHVYLPCCSRSAAVKEREGAERDTGRRGLAEMNVDDFFEGGFDSSSDDDADAVATASATAHRGRSKTKER